MGITDAKATTRGIHCKVVTVYSIRRVGFNQSKTQVNQVELAIEHVPILDRWLASLSSIFNRDGNCRPLWRQTCQQGNTCPRLGMRPEALRTVAGNVI